MYGTPSSPAQRVARFGPFEIDFVAGELRKQGRRVRLQEQPFQLLALLLARPGDVVTREELRNQLWPADTFVDFDHSLNTAINKVREALEDSASSPKYVETLARRGYRFVAKVEHLPDPPVVGPSPGPVAPINGNVPAAVHPDLEVPLPHRALTRGLFALVQVMYLVFYLEALFHLPQIDRIADSFLPDWGRLAIVTATVMTAGVGILVRCYLISGVGFDYLRLREKFEKIFLFVLPLDQLWAIAPFLLAQKTGFGPAFAATAALVYVPFAERTLLRLAYPGPKQ